MAEIAWFRAEKENKLVKEEGGEEEILKPTSQSKRAKCHRLL